MGKNLKILVLEDDIMDVKLISKTLEWAGMNFTTTVVTDKPEFEAAINTYHFDVILADNSLPQFDAVSALRLMRQKKIETPFILVTGTVSEEFAVDVIHKGADDYILKANLKKLPSAIDGAITKWAIRKEKERAEKALRESEQRFRILFEQAADGIVISDRRGNITDANSSVCALTGYTLGELKKMNLHNTFFAEDMASDPVSMEELLSGKAIFSERRVKRKDMANIFVELSAKLLPDGRLQAIARDVTYRKQLEAQLLIEKVNHQKILAQATLDGQEKERTQLGRELHDNVNQILTATKLLLNASLHDDTIREELLAKSIDNLSKAIEETRKLSKSLVTPAVNELSVIESIRDLVETVQITTPIHINLTTPNESDMHVNSRQQIALYRIVQEQINNIIKHAEAHTIDMLLEINNSLIHLEIADDGKGFDIRTKRTGIGFSNMQSRAELLNGTLSVKSEPGKGCVLKVDIPLDTENLPEPFVAGNLMNQE